MVGEGPLRATEPLGNVNDPAVVIALERRLGGAFEIDPVDFEWAEVRGRTHRKRSAVGRELAISLTEAAAARGLADGDALACAPAPPGGRPAVVAVRLRSVDALLIGVDPGDALLAARVAWEVGNMHAPLFRGRRPGELIAPASAPLERLLAPIPGVSLDRAEVRLDPADRLSGNGISVVVRLAPDLKLIVRRAEA